MTRKREINYILNFDEYWFPRSSQRRDSSEQIALGMLSFQFDYNAIFVEGSAIMRIRSKRLVKPLMSSRNDMFTFGVDRSEALK